MTYTLKQILILFAVITTALIAQSKDIKYFLQLADSGKLEEARLELQNLRQEFVNTPEYLYLDALLTEDGIAAVRKYTALARQFPKTVYAAKGLQRVYTYLYSIGSYDEAARQLASLRAQFPQMSFESLGVSKPAVKKDTVKPVQSAPPAKQGTVLPGSFTLRIGAFAVEQNVKKLADNLKKDGYIPSITEKVDGEKKLYILQAGNFKTIENAQKASVTLKAKYKIDAVPVKVTK